ncbi:hypothetical protein IDJ77_03755 [Mucilaginibacter sp. ZT4R22]|uniref:Uncharacterized protein n=1 Tax=Mucilaginibacter pankratovii TaxID=2772110 RepID=A0ABR7WKT1_9SPHI|nr:hypothetical protein [Mucilaginibacter pankratovii]MBD1362915.1 hypothetical protein [Mucilaginibacter pankratovii]
MNLPHYNSTTTDFKEYEFFSDGPKGRIKKLVTFTRMQVYPVMYNLAFGDADPETGLMNDLITSNNEDRDVVLATVANTIIKFCDHYGDHFIFAKGSTPTRTRLYQMGINRLISEIGKSFDVYGMIGDEIYQFQTNVNYDAFLVKRK